MSPDPVQSRPGSGAGPREALQKHFGFREFRAGQEPVISALLDGRDALAVMPTGGGKSLCYQLPALVLEGVTLVVSPLIALMKDQVDALQHRGIPATMINSTLTASEQTERLARLARGEYKLVYIAPERFRSSAFLRSLRQVKIALFAVDEAHCLSQWGHDFRPDYLRLAEAVETLGHPQTAAFTATATPEVRKDILSVLSLRDPLVTISGFERPNLALRVRQCGSNREKYEHLHALVKRRSTGIVYCATRKKVEEVSASLSEMGIKLIAYHGGMDDRDRAWAQNRFLDRSHDVAVATNAFGMGIDRPDVRFVAHFDVPGSVEAYYQEAGRAGRDGEPAECELLFNYADTRTQEFFIEGNNPGYELIIDLYSALRHFAGENHEVVMTVRDLAGAINVKNDMQVSSALSHLSRAGYIERYDVPGERTRGTRLRYPEIDPVNLELDHAALSEKERRDRAKLEAMVRFCYEEATCRQAWILHYFGEDKASNCGACDVCSGGNAGDRREPDDDEFTLVRKALSGVARASKRGPGGRWEPRFGKTKIVQMLAGSPSADLVAGGLDRLSTYGILSDRGTNYLYALFGEMENAGLVVTIKTPYPLLTLTSRGDKVMRGNRDFTLRWPDPRTLPQATGAKPTGRRASARYPNSVHTSGDPSPGTRIQEAVLDGESFIEPNYDEELYDRLCALRRDMAKAEGGKPAYVIFSNEVLKSLTRLQPGTAEEALRIPGIGQVKADRYLEPFLEMIRGHDKS